MVLERGHPPVVPRVVSIAMLGLGRLLLLPPQFALVLIALLGLGRLLPVLLVPAVMQGRFLHSCLPPHLPIAKHVTLVLGLLLQAPSVLTVTLEHGPPLVALHVQIAMPEPFLSLLLLHLRSVVEIVMQVCGLLWQVPLVQAAMLELPPT